MAERKSQTKAPTSANIAHASEAVQHYFHALDTVQAATPAPQHRAPTVDISDEITREQKIKNDNAEQDITLKRKTLNRLFWFLGAETFAIFAFAVLQGARWPAHFHLEEWSFKVVISATILQITAMLYTVVKYLFPAGKV